MTVDYFTVRLSEDWHGEAERAYTSPDLIDRLVVLAWIALVGLQPFDGPVFDAEPGEGRWMLIGVCSRLVGLRRGIQPDYSGVRNIRKVFC